jgi:hypothetical protein
MQNGGGWLTPCLGHFTPLKETQQPLYRKLGWLHGRYGAGRKLSQQPRFDPRTAQPVASRYTDWSIADHLLFPGLFIFLADAMALSGFISFFAK